VSRGETLFAVALLTALAIWVAGNPAAARADWREPDAPKHAAPWPDALPFLAPAN